jgi:hypothetical protein
MFRRATILVGAFFFAATNGFFVRRSAAETRPEPIAWTYRAPPDCPPAEAFESKFRARTTRAELVAGVADASRAFTVTLSSESGRSDREVVGRIEIQGTAGAISTREVAGPTCQGVVSALALIAAIAVDPLAADSSEPPARAMDAPSPPPSASDERAREGATPTPRTFLAAGVDSGAVVGLFPKAAPRVSLFAEAHLEQVSPLAPSARLSLSGAASSSVAAPPGSATFRWLAAALDGCPLEVRFVQAVRATPCTFVELGVLTATGAGVDLPAVENRRWVALGGAARLTWLFLGSFFVEAHGRLEAPLWRDTFVLAAPERVVVHAVPAVLGSANIGVGARW